MTKDIVQTLIETHVDNEIDVDDTVEQLADAGLLTERQAEAIVRVYLADEAVADAAAAMGVTESRVYNSRQDADAKLLAADETLQVLSRARRDAEPDPYE